MAWASYLISNVLFASLIALVAWAVQRWLKRPAVARVLWVLALVKLVTPPLVGVPVIELPTTMACTLGACGCAKHAATSTTATVLWILFAAWSIGAGATTLLASRRWMRLRRLIAAASPAPREWQ